MLARISRSTHAGQVVPNASRTPFHVRRLVIQHSAEITKERALPIPCQGFKPRGQGLCWDITGREVLCAAPLLDIITCA